MQQPRGLLPHAKGHLCHGTWQSPLEKWMPNNLLRRNPWERACPIQPGSLVITGANQDGSLLAGWLQFRREMWRIGLTKTHMFFKSSQCVSAARFSGHKDKPSPPASLGYEKERSVWEQLKFLIGNSNRHVCERTWLRNSGGAWLGRELLYSVGERSC